MVYTESRLREDIDFTNKAFVHGGEWRTKNRKFWGMVSCKREKYTKKQRESKTKNKRTGNFEVWYHVKDE